MKLFTNTAAFVKDLNQRKEIISNLHGSLTGGHRGINSTYEKIRSRFFWNGMRNDITNFVRSCRDCLTNKIDRINRKAPMVLTETPIEPFDKISIDTVEKLRTTVRGHNYILTIQCNLTKYLIAVPIKNLRATTIADALVRHVICQFGAPLAILSDRGTSFVSEVVHSVMSLFKIQQLTTSGYAPWTNGLVERSHAPLADFIRIYGESYSDWDLLLPFATFTYNTSINTSTNFTPHELFYGRVARFPIAIPNEERLRTYNAYMRDLVLRLNQIRTVAAEKLIAGKQHLKERFDRNVRPCNIKMGDFVLIKREIRNNKFDQFYDAPVEVVKTNLGINNISLKLSNGKIIRKKIPLGSWLCQKASTGNHGQSAEP